MATIWKNPNPTAGVAGTLGNILGAGVSNYQQRQQQQQEEERRRGFIRSLEDMGIPRDKAEQISQMSQKQQEAIFRDQLQKQQETDSFSEIFGSQQQEAPQQQQGFMDVLQQGAPQQQEFMDTLQGQGTQQGVPQQQQSPVQNMINEMQQQGMPIPGQQQQQPAQAPRQQQAQTESIPQETQSQLQELSGPSLSKEVDDRWPNTPQEKRELQSPQANESINLLQESANNIYGEDAPDVKSVLSNQKLSNRAKKDFLTPLIKSASRGSEKTLGEREKRKTNIIKEFSQEQQSIQEKADKAQSSNDILSELRKISTEGALTKTDTLAKTLQNATGGYINFDILRSPDGERFETLTSNLIDNVKSIFGGNVSNKEVELYMKRLPSLIQSRQGQISAINFLEKMNNAAIKRSEIMDQIMEENNGRIPSNWRTQLNKRMKPFLQEFSNTMKKQNKKDLKKQRKATQESDQFLQKESGISGTLARFLYRSQ